MWAVETTEHSTDVWTMSLEEQNQPNLKTILYVLCIHTFGTCYPSNGVVWCMNYSPVVSATVALLFHHAPETAGVN